MRNLLCVWLLIAFGCSGGSAFGQRIESLDWAADSQSLFVSLEANIQRIPIDGSGTEVVVKTNGRDVFASENEHAELLFASDHTDISQIFLREFDGEIVQLTDSGNKSSWPDWSPDASQITFMRKIAGYYQVWIMDRDGANQQPLVVGDHNNYNPRFSPDGKHILFESDRHGGDQDEIYSVRISNKAQSRLTETAGNDIYPAWSHDGKRIAWCTIEQGRAFIYFANADGSDARRMLEDACKPVWSRDGKHLAFVAIKRDTPEQLMIANADSSEPKAVAIRLPE